jgi:hypothetical protein
MLKRQTSLISFFMIDNDNPWRSTSLQFSLSHAGRHNKYYEENNFSFAPKCMPCKFQGGYRL